MTPSSNPLRKHFRQPAIYLRLPSGGKFYPPEALDMPPNQELPVFPMTALDEIITRTPDALFNGTATVELIRSCIPNIRDPWWIPATDLNSILVAMRVASYGHDIEINTTCPKCQHEHRFDLDLRRILDNLKSPNYDEPLIFGDLTLYFAPLSYKIMNDINIAQFEDQKITQVIDNSDLSDKEKLAKMSEAMRRISHLTLVTVANSISAVKTQDAMVTEKNHIVEFLENCDKQKFTKIKDHVISLRTNTDFKPLEITCANCSNHYKQDFTLDQTSFFETVS